MAGPTAVGKTATAVAMAKKLHTEIVSCDSRQFYREMTIGTAVPTAEELKAVPHHFIQHKSIADHYDVATYTADALQLFDSLFHQSRFLVLTGGSGLFLDAVCHGLDELPETTESIRQQVQEIFLTEGLSGLQSRVAACDPEYYAQADIQNPRRLQRAFEVHLATGRPFSSFRQGNKNHRNFQCVKIGLHRDRKELIQRIDERVNQMMQQGLLQEANGLYGQRHCNALNTVGYKELFEYLDGKLSLDQAIEKIKTNTRQYAKRQMTWFRKDKAYRWFDPTDLEGMMVFIEQMVGERK